jgi:hypothetical protein
MSKIRRSKLLLFLLNFDLIEILFHITSPSFACKSLPERRIIPLAWKNVSCRFESICDLQNVKLSAINFSAISRRPMRCRHFQNCRFHDVRNVVAVLGERKDLWFCQPRTQGLLRAKEALGTRLWFCMVIRHSDSVGKVFIQKFSFSACLVYDMICL